MSPAPTVPPVPGTGPDEPEPEDPGQRQQIIDDNEQRRKDEADAFEQRSTDAKAFYSGGAAQDAEPVQTQASTVEANENLDDDDESPPS